MHCLLPDGGFRHEQNAAPLHVMCGTTASLIRSTRDRTTATFETRRHLRDDGAEGAFTRRKFKSSGGSVQAAGLQGWHPRHASTRAHCCVPAEEGYGGSWSNWTLSSKVYSTYCTIGRNT